MPATAQPLLPEPNGADGEWSLNRYFGARTHEAPELRCVPVRQPNAAMRFGTADRRRFGRAMKAKMFFVDVDPDDADGIIRSGRNLRFCVRGIGVPEEIG